MHQLLPTPNKSILYTPFKAAAIAAPAGKVTLTLPRGSTLVDAPAACSKVVAPTSAKDGFVSCPVPQLSLGENVIRKITWESPPNMGHGQDTQPNVNMRATYAPRRSPRSVDLEESLLSYTDPIRTTMSPFLDYTGPTPAHTPDALTFNTGALPDEGPLADPVVEIRVPAHMHLNSTTFPSCGNLAGFGGGSVFCSLPNGAGGSYSGDLTFHANAPGTYRPKVTFFADNAPTAAKRRTLTVSP